MLKYKIYVLLFFIIGIYSINYVRAQDYDLSLLVSNLKFSLFSLSL